MDFLLLSLALLIQMLAGFGISRLILHRQSFNNLTESFALSFLLGVAFVSCLLFLLGLVVPGGGLRWSVTAICLVIGWIGWQRQRPQLRFRDFWPQTLVGRLLLAISVGQIAVVGWLCWVRVLGWDGLLNYEAKARWAFLRGGALPLSYFSDPSRDWSHQDYPLLLPLAESWLYLWIGRPDQQVAKIIPWMFFVSAACLLHAAGCRFMANQWQRLVAPLIVFCVPLLLIGDGSVSTGYADFPMAVFYLGTIMFVIEFWRSENFAALQMAGLLSAAGCWLKQDGIILWACMAILVCLKALVEFKRWKFDWRKWLKLAMALSFGLLVFVGWRAFIGSVSAVVRSEIQPVEYGTLRANAWLLPIIIKGVVLELLTLRHWGFLWMITFLSIGWMLVRHRNREAITLALAVVLPILAFASLHFFFHGSPLTRLLIHVSLVAALTVALTIQPMKPINWTQA